METKESPDICFGYVDFSDPNWARNFSVSPSYVRRFEDFQQAALTFATVSPTRSDYTNLVRNLNVKCFSVSNVPCSTERNGALIEALAGLYQEIADRIVPINTPVHRIQRDIRIYREDLLKNLAILQQGRGAQCPLR